MREQSSDNPDLPELDGKKTKAAIERVMSNYRNYKYIYFEDREASVTASYEDRPSGPTNVTSDQTASIAIYNVDARQARKDFCQRVERAVNELPKIESFLIQKRYMNNDAEYITDQRVFSIEFQPPISKDTYAKFRRKAMYRLILKLDDLKIIKITEVFRDEPEEARPE
ncbi:ArpU family phage packaging/lysis transcriptional regulator [Paenibacillus sp. FSL R7-0333]|uniref:ArpU family phage packaging/lysis transcriptional regulator n=1 Tax=Paenibacillus sp. FSL R7-0333 TaxID=1926587 RepID=UPI00096F7CBB|nr:transcriptional regulator [Paenibacillus sp. FSL R7-0333]